MHPGKSQLASQHHLVLEAKIDQLARLVAPGELVAQHEELAQPFLVIAVPQEKDAIVAKRADGESLRNARSKCSD